jgi:hypothetical protein
VKSAALIQLSYGGFADNLESARMGDDPRTEALEFFRTRLDVPVG